MLKNERGYSFNARLKEFIKIIGIKMREKLK